MNEKTLKRNDGGSMKLNRGFYKNDNNKEKIKLDKEIITGRWVYWDLLGNTTDSKGNHMAYPILIKSCEEGEIELKVVNHIYKIWNFILPKTICTQATGTEFYEHDIVRDSYNKLYEVVYDKSRVGYGLIRQDMHIYSPFSQVSKINKVGTIFDYIDEEEYEDEE